MRDEMWDIVVGIVLLAIGISIGLNMIHRADRFSITQSKIGIEDKNTNRLVGTVDKKYGEFSGSLTDLELLLTTQVQDYYMPEPKRMKIGTNGSNNEIEITSTYKSDLFNYMNTTYDILKSRGYPNGTEFDIIYSLGNTGNKEDDAYKIIPIYYCNGKLAGSNDDCGTKLVYSDSVHRYYCNNESCLEYDILINKGE